MRQQLTLSMVLLAGVAIGGLAVGKLNAQQQQQRPFPRALVITELNVTNPTDYVRDYAPKVAPTFQPFDGRFIARGTPSVDLGGDQPPRVIITGFDSLEKARAWQESAAFKDLRPIRDKSASLLRSFIIETCASQQGQSPQAGGC